jgi:hypothetical protein
MTKRLTILSLAVLLAAATFADTGIAQSATPKTETAKPKLLTLMQGTGC